MSEPPSEPPFNAAALMGGELFWRDHYQWLEASGYQLRPRFKPGWMPSWLSKDGKELKYWASCEDGQWLHVSFSQPSRYVYIRQHRLRSCHIQYAMPPAYQTGLMSPSNLYVHLNTHTRLISAPSSHPRFSHLILATIACLSTMS